MKLWAVRDISTGKFVNNLTNPGKKFWEKKKCAVDAMNRPNRNAGFKGDTKNLRLVEFNLVEIEGE